MREEFAYPRHLVDVAGIRRIRNAFSVYLDPDRQEPDGSDARWGFITEMVTRDEFKEKWPGADPMLWSQTGIGDMHRLWIEQTNVRIAEYYEIEHEVKKLVMLSNGVVELEEEIAPEVWKQIDAGRLEIIDERDTEVPQTHWYFVTAREILEGRFPERVLEKAVERMIPRGPLGRMQMGNLHVYPGAEHPHEAQQPEKVDIAKMNRKNMRAA